MAELFGIADTAMAAVLGDAGVWFEEDGREEAEPLPWPVKHGRGLQQLLAMFFEEAVVGALEALQIAHGLHLEPDPSDPRFQVVLRVCARAVDAALAVATERFGGLGRLSGKRDLLNWMKRRDAGAAYLAAARAGKSREEAIAAACDATGLSRAGVYRALSRDLSKS
jgi:hypothetical protein